MGEQGRQGQYCRNCRAPLGGEYCGQCGQREGRADQRFVDLAGELLGDVVDMDSRLWRTFFYLLLRPGYLTAEFIAGRRARYLPPLRLYLVISFVVFLLMSLDTSLALSPGDGVAAEGGEAVVVAIDAGEASPAGDAGDAGDEWSPRVELAAEDSPQWMKDLERRMESNLPRLKDDPGEFIATLVSYLPQMMFLLLPLFALLIRCAYLLSPFHYLQHLVFALHYHCYVYLLYLLSKLLEYAGLALQGLVFAALVAYLPLALRRAYGSGWGAALGKSLLIYASYAVVLVLGFAAVALLVLLML